MSMHKNTSKQLVVKTHSSDMGDVSFEPLERQHTQSSTCPVSALTTVLLNTGTEETLFYRRETQSVNTDWAH